MDHRLPARLLEPATGPVVAGRSTTCVTGDRDVFRVPSFSSSSATERCCQSSPDFGGRIDSAMCTNLTHERFRLWAKSEIDPSLGAEQVRDDWITTAFHALE